MIGLQAAVDHTRVLYSLWQVMAEDWKQLTCAVHVQLYSCEFCTAMSCVSNLAQGSSLGVSHQLTHFQ